MPTKYELGRAAWPILVEWALARKTDTYQALARKLGYVKTARPMRMALWPILDLCNERGYPPLTSLVVNKTTGSPGKGFTTTFPDPERAQREVWEYGERWRDIPTPWSGPGGQVAPAPRVLLGSSESTEPISYEVADSQVVVNGRGPYQDAFRRVLDRVYGSRCALCDSRARELLVAAHVVPWSRDPANRLNPRNGILLCRLHDAAFDARFVVIREDLSVQLNLPSAAKLGGDAAMYLRSRTSKRLRVSRRAFAPTAELLRYRLERRDRLSDA